VPLLSIGAAGCAGLALMTTRKKSRRDRGCDGPKPKAEEKKAGRRNESKTI